MNKSKEQRIAWLDTARAISIMLVVLGHSLVTQVRENNALAMMLYNIIYSFHMPLWLLLSGYVLRLSLERNSTNQILKNKIKQLIIPYFVYGTFVYMIFAIISNIHFFGNMLPEGTSGIGVIEYFVNMLMGKNIYSIHLWYIYVLFIYYLIVIGIINICNRIRISYRIILFVISVIVLLLRRTICINFPDIITTYLMPLFIYFIVGVCIDINNISRKNTITLVIIFIGLAFVLKKVDLVGATRYITATYYILKTVEKMTLIIVLCKMFKYLTHKLADKIRKTLDFVSLHCLDIYLWHLPFCTTCVGAVLYKVMPNCPFLIVTITFVIGMVAPIIITNIISKIKRSSLLWLKRN